MHLPILIAAKYLSSYLPSLTDCIHQTIAPAQAHIHRTTIAGFWLGKCKEKEKKERKKKSNAGYSTIDTQSNPQNARVRVLIGSSEERKGGKEKREAKSKNKMEKEKEIKKGRKKIL